jgi:hypothetical protein
MLQSPWKIVPLALLFVLTQSNIMVHPSSMRSTKTVLAQIDSSYARFNASMREANTNPTQFISTIQDIIAPGKMKTAILEGAEATAKAGGDVDLVKTNCAEDNNYVPNSTWKHSGCYSQTIRRCHA